MSFVARRVLAALDRRRWSERAVFELMGFGMPLYEFLADGLRAGAWNARQSANALYLLGNLVRESCSVRRGELLGLALELSIDEREDVRNAAVRVAVTLARLATRYPQLGIGVARERVVVRLAQAIEKGLGAEEKLYAESFCGEARG